MSNKLYNKDSIESLSPLEFTRLRPGVYAGDTTYSTQLLVEIVSNAIDEFNLGHGNLIEVTIDNTNKSVMVQDYGQGFLVNEVREDGKTVLEAAFSVLNTSGKYREDGTYEGTSLGSFGVGSKITTYLSHWLQVATFRDGKYEQIRFVEGEFDNRVVGETGKEEHGTTVHWQPSEEFFTHPEVDINAIKTLFETLTCLCPGLTIKLTELFEDTDKSQVYCSQHGLDDYVDSHVGDKEILNNRLSINYINGKNKMNAVLTYSSNYSSTIVPYVNTGLTESGPHITAFKTTITREFNKFFREKGWLKDKDNNLTGDDIQEGLYLVFNITTSGVTYDAQVKSRVVNIETKEFMQEFSSQLQTWLNTNAKEVKGIADKALNARKAREAAKKAREAVRKPKEKGLKAKMALSDKFIDCTSKSPAERNLLLVEGKSASTSAIEARNPITDCIYMLRGKTISPLKTSVDKILANQEMSDIIKVIGAGFGNENFDVNKMNFDKIVITSDQDADGFSIELLLITFFYTFMRPLIEAGKLYRAVTPLYIVTHKNKDYYCFTEKELEEWKTTHTGSYELLRAKGLGELDAIDLRRVCFENERYKRITISDAAATTNLLEILQGSAVEPRKKYIYENAKELGFNFI